MDRTGSLLGWDISLSVLIRWTGGLVTFLLFTMCMVWFILYICCLDFPQVYFGYVFILLLIN